METDLRIANATVRVHAKDEFGACAAAHVAHEIREAVAKRGRCSLALAGGATPRPVYEELARTDSVPWEAVDFYFGDERAVDPAHPRSNYASARRSLLGRISVSDRKVHRMHGEHPDLAGAARAYEQELPRHLDVLLLGIGVDGHVASIFPLSRALAPGEDRVMAVRAPVSREWRLTITPPVIRDARRVIVLARGRRKAGVVQRAVRSTLTLRRCPARAAADGMWILDEEAARRIVIPIPAGGGGP